MSGPSARGTASFTLEDPPRGPSLRGTANFTLTDPEGEVGPPAWRWDGTDLIPVEIYLGSDFS